MEKCHTEGCWVSLILRLAMATLFIGAVVPKWTAPPGSLVASFEAMFKDTWLPMELVRMKARAVPWIETILPIWLILGFRLRWAWVATALFLTSLAFGMVVAKAPNAALTYLYVLIACVGLYFSQFDKLNLGCLFGKKEGCCAH